MQKQTIDNQYVDLVKVDHFPPVDKPIADRIRGDFLKPQMFVPQHLVPQCRPVFVPIHTDDPLLEGYPNIELKGEYARFVVPPIDDFSTNREDRVIYQSESNNHSTDNIREKSEKRETNETDKTIKTNTTILQSESNSNSNSKSKSKSKSKSISKYKSGLFGDYIRSFSLRHKDKNISDEEALDITYPLYHIDTRYSDEPTYGGSTRSSRKKTRKNGKKRFEKKHTKYSRKYHKLLT